MEELLTERTVTIIMRLKTEGTPQMPALVMARTKGEALASSEVCPLGRLGSVYGTRRPMSKREMR